MSALLRAMAAAVGFVPAALALEPDEEDVFCPRCGGRWPKGTAFCGACGAKL